MEKHNTFLLEHNFGYRGAISGCIEAIFFRLEHNFFYPEHNSGCLEMILGRLETISGYLEHNWGLGKCKNSVLAWIGSSCGGSAISVRVDTNRGRELPTSILPSITNQKAPEGICENQLIRE